MDFEQHTLDFEEGLPLSVKVHKGIKNFMEEIDGKEVRGQEDIICLTLNQSTNADSFRDRLNVDKFYAEVQDNIDSCYNIDAKLFGSEFVAYVGYPLSRHIRIFFSQPATYFKQDHFYVMTKEVHEILAKKDGENILIDIIPRAKEVSDIIGHNT